MCVCVRGRARLELHAHPTAMACQLCHVCSVAQWKIMEGRRDGDRLSSLRYVRLSGSMESVCGVMSTGPSGPPVVAIAQPARESE